jgi:hypothetical protein
MSINDLVTRREEELNEQIGSCMIVVRAYADSCFFDESKKDIKELANTLINQWLTNRSLDN